MKQGKYLTTLASLLTAWALYTPGALAANATVYVDINGFTPSSVSITVGGTVDFIAGDDEDHCIQSTIGAWTPWYLWFEGDGVRIRFNETGDYYYRDAFNPDNTGVVHVGPGNVPPSVSITSPVQGAVFTEPASFTLSADISDSDDGISRAEFYIGSDLVDVLSTAPFSTLITNLAAAEYTLTIIAYDTSSAVTTKSVSVSVQPATQPVIILSGPRLMSGQFQFEVSGLSVGKQAVLQASASVGSLANWISLQTNDVSSSNMSLTWPAAPSPRFFRVLQLL